MCFGECSSDEIDDLIPCIIQVESGGNPLAIGSSGKIGLCQISPIVLKEYNQWRANRACEYGKENPELYFTGSVIPFIMEDLKNPDLNKYVSTWYLRRLKDHYLKENYTIETLLASYNWGIGNVRKVNYNYERFPKSVKRYIKKVLKCRR